MICSVARIGPALYLRADVNLMDIGNWTRALLAAVVSTDPKAPDYAPPWFALEALTQLGFGRQAVKQADDVRDTGLAVIFGSRTIEAVERRDFFRWRPQKGQGGSRHSAVIFSKSPRATMARGRPTERYAVLALGFDELSKKAQTIWGPDAKGVIELLDSPLVAVEMAGAEGNADFDPLDPTDDALVKFFRLKSEEPVFLAFPKPDEGYYFNPYNRVVARNLDELFSEAASAEAARASRQRERRW